MDPNDLALITKALQAGFNHYEQKLESNLEQIRRLEGENKHNLAQMDRFQTLIETLPVL